MLLGLAAAGLASAVATGWGALVLYYLAPGSGTVRTALAWVFVALGLVTVSALAVPRARRTAAIGFAIAFLLVLVVWSRATPSNDRDWQPEVAVLPYATIEGDLVTVHNIRRQGAVRTISASSSVAVTFLGGLGAQLCGMRCELRGAGPSRPG